MRSKTPVRLAGLERANAPWDTLHPAPGDLPRCFTLDFRRYDGPGNLEDGRLLRAVLTPAEMAVALGALPVLSLSGADDDLYRAFKRVTDLLEGKR